MKRPDEVAEATADDDLRADDVQPETPDPDALVEVTHEGRTYTVPAALRGALMRRQDYGRGMQALQDGHAALAQASQALGEHLAEHARLVGLGDEIARLSGLNWPALQQQNPAQAQQLMHQLFQMRQAHELAARALQHKRAVRAFEQQRDQARQVDQAHAVLSREVDGWSPRMAAQLAQYALSQGVTPEELNGVSDPRLVKILRHACIGADAEQRQAAAGRLAKAQSVRPAVEVGGTGGAPNDPNRMSTDDWMRHRRGQLHAKGR